jgi:Tol biopolymer transport system component
MAASPAPAAEKSGAEAAHAAPRGEDPEILAVAEKLRGMRPDQQGGNLAGMFQRMAGIKTGGTFIDLTPDQGYTLLAYCLGDKDLSAVVTDLMSSGGPSGVLEVHTRAAARGNPRELAAVYRIMAHQVSAPAHYRFQFRQDPTVVFLSVRAEAMKHLDDADPHVGLWASEFLLELGYPGEHPALAPPSGLAVDESKQLMAAQAAAVAKLMAAGELMPLLRNCVDKKDVSIVPIILRHGDDPAAPKEMPDEMKSERFVWLARAWMGDWRLSDFDKLQAMAAKIDPESGKRLAAGLVQTILVEQPDDDLYGIVKVLGGTGQKEGIAALVDVAFNTDRQRILEACASGIARIGGKEAAGALAVLLERDFTSLGDNPSTISAARKPVLDALKAVTRKTLVKELGDDLAAWHDYARKDGLIRPAVVSRLARRRELALKARLDSFSFQLCFNTPEGLRHLYVAVGSETRDFHGGSVGRCTPAVGATVIEYMADRGLLDEPRGEGKVAGDKSPCWIAMGAGQTVYRQKWLDLRAELPADGRARLTLMQIQIYLADDPWTDKLVTDLLEKVHLGDWPDEPKPAPVPQATGTSAAAAPAPPAVKLTSREASLGKAMVAIDSLHPQISPDGRHMAYSVKNGGSRFDVRDGVKGKESEGLLFSLFSADSQHLAYAASRNHRCFINIDGVEGKDYDSVLAHSLVFSPDAKRVAYGAQRGKKWLLVVDGAEGKEYDGWAFTSGGGGPVFSPDSKHLAAIADQGGKVLVVVDGAEGKEFDKIGESGLQFSPDSKHLVYIGCQGNKQRLVLDGSEGKLYDWIGGPVFSPDSGHLATQAGRDEKKFLVVDGDEGKEVAAGLPVFSPDSKHLAYAAGGHPRGWVVVDRVAGKEYETVYEFPHFSPDSRHVAYWAERGRSEFLVVDGVEGKSYSDRTVPPPVFSPDSRRVAYWVRRGEERFVIVDGVEGKAWDEIGDRCPFFSPDGKRVAYAARRGRQWFMVVDGVEAAVAYDNIIQPQFSPDSRHMACEARRGGKWFVVVDGVEGPALDGFPDRSRMIFDGPNHLHIIGTRNDEYLLTELEIAEGS